jgi:hypothetical protein
MIFMLTSRRKSLADEDVKALLHSLTSWLIRCVETNEGPLVMRKLCSTLVAYFMQFSTSWTKCIKHLMYCLCIKAPVPYDDSLPGAPETAVLVNELSNDKAIAILWFASSLVEEVGKTDSSLMKQLGAPTRRKQHRADTLAPGISSIEVWFLTSMMLFRYYRSI